VSDEDSQPDDDEKRKRGGSPETKKGRGGGSLAKKVQWREKKRCRFPFIWEDKRGVWAIGMSQGGEVPLNPHKKRDSTHRYMFHDLTRINHLTDP